MNMTNKETREFLEARKNHSDVVMRLLDKYALQGIDYVAHIKYENYIRNYWNKLHEGL